MCILYNGLVIHCWGMCMCTMIMICVVKLVSNCNTTCLRRRRDKETWVENKIPLRSRSNRSYGTNVSKKHHEVGILYGPRGNHSLNGVTDFQNRISFQEILPHFLDSRNFLKNQTNFGIFPKIGKIFGFLSKNSKILGFSCSNFHAVK